jgi:hypothetical protein
VDLGGNDRGTNFAVDVLRNSTPLLGERADGSTVGVPAASITFDDRESLGTTASSIVLSGGDAAAVDRGAPTTFSCQLSPRIGIPR